MNGTTGPALALIAYVMNTLTSAGIWWAVVARNDPAASMGTKIFCTIWLIVNVLLGIALLADSE